MLIRTLRPTEMNGRRVRAFACLDLPPSEAEALIEAGDAEAWQPGGRAAPPMAETPAEPPATSPTAEPKE